MDKINLGSTIPAYPVPVSLVGAHVEGEPEFPGGGVVYDGQLQTAKNGHRSWKRALHVPESKRTRHSAFACLRWIWLRYG